jgi:hypothetical protein
MSHVKLGDANDTDSQTLIRAEGEFMAGSVFSAAAYTASNLNPLIGLEGAGKNGGAGALGRGGTPARNAEAAVAGPGVIGRGGSIEADRSGLPGAGVIGVATNVKVPDPRDSAAVGVYGAGAIGVFGLHGGEKENQYSAGTGVVGVSGSPLVLLDQRSTSGVGVYGASDRGVGVFGLSGGPIEPGVRGKAGVVGVSGNGPGGSFESAQFAQVHLTPSTEVTLPTVGVRGDLWAHVAPNSPKGTKFHQGAVSLYLCVEDFPDVRWQKVQLDTPRLKGGAKVPEGSGRTRWVRDGSTQM